MSALVAIAIADYSLDCIDASCGSRRATSFIELQYYRRREAAREATSGRHGIVDIDAASDLPAPLPRSTCFLCFDDALAQYRRNANLRSRLKLIDRQQWYAAPPCV